MQELADNIYTIVAIAAAITFLAYVAHTWLTTNDY